MFNFTLLESFECPLCEDFGIVEVWVEPAFGLASEEHKAETEWRVCECRKGAKLRPQSARDPDRRGRNVGAPVRRRDDDLS